LTGTINMPDSIYPENLLPGYPAYLAYADGYWPTEGEVRKAHPGAHVLVLTVLGATLKADGVDCEKGDLGAVGAALWVHRKLAADPGTRPVVYADLATPGYSMAEVIAELLALGITRSQYRVLTAHYDGEHVCSPSRGCRDKDGRVIGFTADGTQWTSAFPGANGSKIDMTLLDAGFFGPPPPAVLGPVTHLDVPAIGPHSVRLTWDSPATPVPGTGVAAYQVTIRKGGSDIHGFPVDVPKGTNPESHQFNGLRPATRYEALVRAVATAGAHASPWATVTFTTPAA